MALCSALTASSARDEAAGPVFGCPVGWSNTSPISSTSLFFHVGDLVEQQTCATWPSGGFDCLQCGDCRILMQGGGKPVQFAQESTLPFMSYCHVNSCWNIHHLTWRLLSCSVFPYPSCVTCIINHLSWLTTVKNTMSFRISVKVSKHEIVTMFSCYSVISAVWMDFPMGFLTIRHVISVDHGLLLFSCSMTCKRRSMFVLMKWPGILWSMWLGDVWVPTVCFVHEVVVVCWWIFWVGFWRFFGRWRVLMSDCSDESPYFCGLVGWNRLASYRIRGPLVGSLVVESKYLYTPYTVYILPSCFV